MSKLKKSRKKEIREQVRHLVANHIEAGGIDILPDIDNFITGEDEVQYVRDYLTNLADSMRPHPEEEITNEEIHNGSE